MIRVRVQVYKIIGKAEVEYHKAHTCSEAEAEALDLAKIGRLSFEKSNEEFVAKAIPIPIPIPDYQLISRVRRVSKEMKHRIVADRRLCDETI